MSQQTFDPSSKWMLEKHGAAVLALAGIDSILSCKALQAEIVQPRKLPDGLLEVQYTRKKKGLALVEIATYPESRVVTQIADDIRLVHQARKVLPEALVVVLCEKGTYRVPNHVESASDQGWTTERLSWKVVELWTLDAEELLRSPNVGVVPWVPLAGYNGSTEALLQQCRDRIDREGGALQADLLAVTQVFARLKFDHPRWLDILGGKKAMLESPLLQELMGEANLKGRADSVLHLLRDRFEEIPEPITAGLQQVHKPEALLRLLTVASRCHDLDAFQEALQRELPAPPAKSNRGGKKKAKPK